MISSVQAPRILIVGAGIAGLAAWRALRQQGLDASLIEKHEGWAWVGAGIALPANAVAAFSRLALREPLLRRAHQVTAIEYALADGSTLARASLLDPPLNLAPFVALPRRDLIELMVAGVENVRFNTSIRELRQDAQGVEVTLSHGASERYDLIIAADGIHSSTRAMTFPAARLHDFGMSTWRFIIERDTRDQHPVYYLGRDDAFMLYPIAADQVYCYGHLADPAAVLYRQAAPAVLRASFAHYAPAVGSALAAIDDASAITPGRIQSVITDSAVSGRVALIGDALHGCPPTLQQGAAQALADALTLARLLTAGDTDTALRHYARQRLPQIRWVVGESNKIMRLGKLGRFRLGRLLRNAKVRRQGPANVVGWRSLLTRYPVTTDNNSDATVRAQE